MLEKLNQKHNVTDYLRSVQTMVRMLQKSHLSCTLHRERFASARLSICKDSSIKAIENSLNKISESFIVEISLLRAKEKKTSAVINKCSTKHQKAFHSPNYPGFLVPFFDTNYTYCAAILITGLVHLLVYLTHIGSYL